MPRVALMFAPEGAVAEDGLRRVKAPFQGCGGATGLARRAAQPLRFGRPVATVGLGARAPCMSTRTPEPATWDWLHGRAGT